MPPAVDPAGRRDETPPAYAGRAKYDAARAARYAARSAARHLEEWRVVARLMAGGPPLRTVLDAPCGVGRIALELRARGAHVRLADWSPDMLERARASLGTGDGVLGYERLDLESIPENGVATHDWVVCLRFFHHLPDDAHRLRVLASLRARSHDRVIVSFHHPISVHHLARAARRVCTGRRGDRHALTTARLARLAAQVGLAFERADAVARYRRDFWAARFRIV